MKKTEEPQAEKTVERIPLENTPFTLTRWESEWMIMLGDYVLMRGFKTAGEAELAATTNQWTLTGAFIYAMIDHYVKEKEVWDKTKTAQAETN